MSNFKDCVYLSWFIWRLWLGMKFLSYHQDVKKNRVTFLVNVLPTALYSGGRKRRRIPSLIPIPSGGYAAPPPCWDDWAHVYHSLWNLFSSAAEHHFHQPAQPKIPDCMPKWEMPPHMKTPACSDAFPACQYVFITQIPTPNTTIKAR